MRTFVAKYKVSIYNILVSKMITLAFKIICQTEVLLWQKASNLKLDH